MKNIRRINLDENLTYWCVRLSNKIKIFYGIHSLLIESRLGGGWVPRG